MTHWYLLKIALTSRFRTPKKSQRQSLDLLETFYSNLVCVVGTRLDETNVAKARVIQLSNGIHRFKFRFKLDKGTLASTFDSVIHHTSGHQCRVHVQYHLKLMVDHKTLSHHFSTVRVPILIGGYQYVLTNESEEYALNLIENLSLPGVPGNASVQVSLANPFYYIGDQIEIFLTIDNQFDTDISAIKLEMKNFIHIKTEDRRYRLIEEEETLALFRDNNICIHPREAFKKVLTLSVPPSSRQTIEASFLKIGAYIEVSLILNDVESNEALFRVPFILLKQKGHRRQSLGSYHYKETYDSPSPKVISWVHDSESNICWVCGDEFNVFLRRHHCRLCGLLVCTKCSPTLSIPPVFGSKEQRVCHKCIPKKERSNM